MAASTSKVGGMRYRTLGTSGCAVSELGLGTMTFGAETDEPGSHAQLDRFVEAGGNLVDTADVYTAGASEQIIGRGWRRDRRTSPGPSSWPRRPASRWERTRTPKASRPAT